MLSTSFKLYISHQQFSCSCLSTSVFHKYILVYWLWGVFPRGIAKIKSDSWSDLKPFLEVFQLYHGDSSHYSCLSSVSPVLKAGALKSLAHRHSHEKPRWSSAVRIQDPWIMSKTLNNWATQNPLNSVRQFSTENPVPSVNPIIPVDQGFVSNITEQHRTTNWSMNNKKLTELFTRSISLL